MRSLTLRHLIIASVAATLSGCLVSQDPVLDETTGRDRPLKDGVYRMCPVSQDADENDCETLTASYQEDGAYRFVDDDEEAIVLRFRRIGAKGYAVQAKDGDGYAYYYGVQKEKSFFLTYMQCPDLPENLRTSLVRRGDLEADDDDYETCVVKTMRGLTSAAKAYHRGKALHDEPIIMEFTQAASSSALQE